MICPKCQTASLKQRRVKGKDLDVDVCVKCKGIWFDRTELEQTLGVTGVSLPIPRDAERLTARCPRCRGPLHAFPYPHTRITIEACRQCHGLWLDAGEFQAIRKATEALQQLGESQEEAEAHTVKGSLLRFIDAAIARLQE